MHRRFALSVLCSFAFAANSVMAADSVLDHTVQTLTGQTVDLAEKYSGKVVLVVNVASECGFTHQYAPLQELHEKYAEQGLAIVGVPCNQFGAQEPGAAEEIAAFCQKNYGVTFDMLAKVNVNPPEQCDLYRELTAVAPYDGRVGWNFEKFLISRTGEVVGRFPSGVEPMSPELIAAIEAELRQ